MATVARLMKGREAGASVLNCLILGAPERNRVIPTAFTALKNNSCVCLGIKSECFGQVFCVWTGRTVGLWLLLGCDCTLP